MSTVATNKGSAAERSTSNHQKTSKKKVTGAKAAKASKAKPTFKKSAAANGKKATVPADNRRDTKKAIVLELLRRKEGATIVEIAKATDWQNHSIRGFISGTVTKKMGLVVESMKNQAGARTYRITV